MEHNFQTAYFVIPEDVKHGDGLICSFPACRNRGVKFLYCQYCKDPVAKRNFRSRHNHAEEKAEEDQPKKAPNDSAPASAGDKAKRQEPQPATLRNVVADVTSSSSQHASETSTAASNSTQNEKAGVKRSLDEMNSEHDEMIKRKLSKIAPERQVVWGTLLAERPKSDDELEMSAWLMRVMAVSDSKKPIAENPQGEDSSGTNGSDQATGMSSSTSSNAEEEEDTSSENGDNKGRTSGTSGTSDSLSPTTTDSSGSEDGDISGRDSSNPQADLDGKV